MVIFSRKDRFRQVAKTCTPIPIGMNEKKHYNFEMMDRKKSHRRKTSRTPTVGSGWRGVANAVTSEIFKGSWVWSMGLK